MPYATATQYIQKFGLDETTQALADEQNTLTPSDWATEVGLL